MSTPWCSLTHAVLPGMLARGSGGILNVASTIAFQPAPYQATYGASKAFVLSFSQALWAETKGSGVDGHGALPGADADRLCRRPRCRCFGHRDLSRLVSPEPVVVAGLRGLDRGRAVVIPGLRNWTMANAARYPRVGRRIDQRPDVRPADPARGSNHPTDVLDRTPWRNDHRHRHHGCRRRGPIVGTVRDDPAGRIRLAAETYSLDGGMPALPAVPAGGRRVHAVAASARCAQSVRRRCSRQPVVARGQRGPAARHH